MLRSRRHDNISHTLLVQTVPFVQGIYSVAIHHGFLQFYALGFIIPSTLLLAEYILAVFGIYFYDCASFQCYQISGINDLLRLIYYHAIYPCIVLHLYLLMKIYNQLSDSSRNRDQMLETIGLIFLSLIAIYIFLMLVYNIDTALKEKLHILSKAPWLDFSFFFPVYLTIFLSFPRKITLNLCLCNAPGIAISIVILKHLLMFITNY